MGKIKRIKVGNNVVLKQLELEDAIDIFHIIDSQREYLRKWLPFVDSTKELEDSLSFVSSAINVPDEEKEYMFVIHYNDRFAGLIGFKDTEKENKRTEIGYWLSEIYQKKGIITESVKALLHFAYNELDINRVQIKCAVGNIPSKNIPKRLGFKFEGIERDGELLVDNQFTDLELYSFIKKDINC
ncbi:GNAT family N-acetyltransferase [uncultured Bacteroides sp.]|uniref:GNAT family N-acetyltransferase n=1 Tax=uncultured Bacteroides sp. TaxID=162156 RepID=UPI002AAAA7D1|nr:GNAT family N-acetyltransferase [uncultured Bacteroides sp.]